MTGRYICFTLVLELIMVSKFGDADIALILQVPKITPKVWHAYIKKLMHRYHEKNISHHTYKNSFSKILKFTSYFVRFNKTDNLYCKIEKEASQASGQFKLQLNNTPTPHVFGEN